MNCAGLNPGVSGDSALYLMDYKCPRSPGHSHKAAGPRAHMATTLGEQLLSYSENAENQGKGEEEYLEEEVLQVRSE